MGREFKVESVFEIIMCLTPHTSLLYFLFQAGVMALVLQMHPEATPAQVKQAILDAASAGVVTDPQGPPNFLLNIPGSGSLPTQGPTPTEPPLSTPVELASGQRVVVSLDKGEESHFFITVPAGLAAACYTGFTQASGANGDADLYVKYESSPTTSDYEERGYHTGSNEWAGPTSPRSDEQTLFVMVRGYEAFADLEMWCNIELTSEETVTIAHLDYYERTFYFIDVPAGNQATCSIDGSSGDADLYLKMGGLPTTSDYDARGYISGSVESVGPIRPTSDQTLVSWLEKFSPFMHFRETPFSLTLRSRLLLFLS